MGTKEEHISVSDYLKLFEGLSESERRRAVELSLAALRQKSPPSQQSEPLG